MPGGQFKSKSLLGVYVLEVVHNYIKFSFLIEYSLFILVCLRMEYRG